MDAQRPARAWKLGTVAVVVWLLAGFLSTLEIHAFVYERALPISWWRIFVTQLGRFVPFALLIPVVYALTGRRPFRLTRPSSLWPHALAVLIYSAVDNLAFTLYELGHPLRAFQSGRTEVEPVSGYLQFFPRRVGYGLLVYVLFYGVAAAVHYYRRNQARDLRAVQLERQLQNAKLRALQNQLRPHFLFNTLHAISTLMGEDVKEARRMMALLGELLRLSLDQEDRQEVTLEEELAALGLYLSIEQIRFQDRLRIDRQVPEDLLAASVPHFVLQPIVENAIRHGIGALSSAGRIEIRAERAKGGLRLSVRDDGPGAEEAVRFGLGLENLKARLEELYGDAGGLTVSRPEAGGFCARVALPLRFSAEASSMARTGEPVGDAAT